MQGDLVRTKENRQATHRVLGQNAAFASIFAALVAFVVAFALDCTWIVPLSAGQNTYNPLRDFLSYEVDAQSGPLMTGVFLLLASSAWSYAIAATLVPTRPSDRINRIATFLFGLGLFVGACFRAVPTQEIAAAAWLKTDSRLHDIGIGGGFIPAMIAAFLDQKQVVFKRVPGFLLTKISFWMIVIGAITTALSMLLYRGTAGLCQRILVAGTILWLATEAHQLFWVACGDEQGGASEDEPLPVKGSK